MNYQNADYVALKNTQTLYQLNLRIQELENRLSVHEQKLTPKSIQFDITLSDEWQYPIDKEIDETPYYIMVSNKIDSNEPADRTKVENFYAFAYGLTNLITSKDPIPELTNDVFDEMYNANNITMTLYTEKGVNFVLNLLDRSNNNNIDFILITGDKMMHAYGINRANINKTTDGTIIIRFVTIPHQDYVIKENGKYTVKITWI